MFSYVGSKRLIAKQILDIILAYDYVRGMKLYEPFCGGGNFTQHIPASIDSVSSDVCEYTITLLNAVKNGWLPPEHITEGEYRQAREKAKAGEVSPLIAFIGFQCSFGGKWFGGYARSPNSRGLKRNFCAEGRRRFLRERHKLENKTILHSAYDELPIAYGSIIYCDPPYSNRLGYKNEFDSQRFWNWALEMAKYNGCAVWVSEYSAPDFAVKIWERSVRVGIDAKMDAEKSNRIECLFRIGV